MFEILSTPEVVIGIIALGGAIAMFAYAATDYFEELMDFVEKDFKIQFRRLRMSTKGLRRYLVTWWLIVMMLVIFGWVGLGLPVLGTLAGFVLIGLPWWLVRRMAKRRREQIEDQLADAMVSMSSSIKAGLSLAQAMEILASQCPEPICQEFRQIYGEYKMGKTMERCLIETKERLRS